MATGIKVGDIMRRGVITIKKDDTIEKAAQVMEKTGIGGFVVTEKGKIIGIITEGDIIKKIIAKGKDIKKSYVENAMSKPVRTIGQDMDVEDAMALMRDVDIERLPVVTDGKLVGIVTQRTLTRISPSLLEMVKEKGNLDRIPTKEKMISLSGECENCGNYSDMLRVVEDRLLCEDCRDTA